MWGNAFLNQARSDWAVYNELMKLKIDDCHRLYYLRITTEKLGKAALLKNGSFTVESVYTHKLFVKYLRLSTRDTNLCSALGIKPSQLKVYISDILAIADKIENLVPMKDQPGPNAEYPWELLGTIFSPCSYKFPEVALLSSPQGRKFVRTVHTILDKFEAIYQ